MLSTTDVIEISGKVTDRPITTVLLPGLGLRVSEWQLIDMLTKGSSGDAGDLPWFSLPAGVD